MIAVADTLERMENQLQHPVELIPAPRFGKFYGEPIRANDDSPAYSKKFLKYYIWYVMEKTHELLLVVAIEYAPKDPGYLSKMLTDRTGGS